MSDFRSLADAVVALKEFHGISGRDNLLREAITAAGRDTTDKSLVFHQVMNIVDGGRRVSQILAQLEGVSAGDDTQLTEKDLTELIAIYYDGDSPLIKGTIAKMTGESVNSTKKEPQKNDTSVAIIQVLPADITPANRFTDASALLLTAIPTLEFSRSVPYLDIRLVLPRPPLDGQNRPLGLSIFKFLMGSSVVSSDLEKDMINAGGVATGNTLPLPSDAVEGDPPPPEIFTSTGMELFTSPQTLVNADEGFDPNTGTRHAPIIDRFRPLMTFKNLEFTVVPTHDMMSYKSGKMQFTLHDRSRLGEIADLIRPDLYGNVEMLIEYGWSHPDSRVGNNVYGALLNSTRVKEKYGIMNSSFVFGEGGQVDITLEIYMKGVTDFSTTKIAQSKKVTSLIEEIENLLTAVSVAKTNIFAGTQEVRGTTVLNSPSDVSSALSLDDDTRKEIVRFINDNLNPDIDPDKKKLVDGLKSLYGTDGTNGKVKDLQKTFNTVYSERKKSLLQNSDFPLELLEDAAKTELSGAGQNNFVSLGKLFLRFMAEPLAATGRFDEVQLLFYCFNSGAGAARHSNIGSFPINVSTFIKAFEKYVEGRGAFNVTIKEFISYVSNNFIDDQSNPAYGLSGIKNIGGRFDDGVLKPPELSDKERTALNSAVEEKIQQMDIEDGVFRMPQVDLYVEALPLGKGDESTGDADNGDDQITLLRIHIFDKQSTPHMALQSLLDAMLDRNLGTFGEATSTDTDVSKHKKLAANILARAMSTEPPLIVKLDSPVEGKTTYRLSDTANPAAVKKFVSDTAPTLRYGNAATGLKGVAMRSLQEPLLNTIHMQRAGLGDPSGAPGTDGGIVPMQLLPTELEMDTFGCPLINFGSQFFIDMDTGTTVDNIYGVVGLTHRIEQGKFDSHFKMINIDAYGKFRSAINSIKVAIDELSKDGDDNEDT